MEQEQEASSTKIEEVVWCLRRRSRRERREERERGGLNEILGDEHTSGGALEV